MNPPKPEAVLRNLELTYAMIEAVEEFTDRDLIEARAAIAFTIMNWGGIAVDFPTALSLEREKRHIRKGASNGKLTLVPDSEPWKINPPGTELP